MREPFASSCCFRFRNFYAPNLFRVSIFFLLFGKGRNPPIPVESYRILLEKESINPQANQNTDYKSRQDGKGLQSCYEENLRRPIFLNRDMEDQDEKGSLADVL